MSHPSSCRARTKEMERVCWHVRRGPIFLFSIYKRVLTLKKYTQQKHLSPVLRLWGGADGWIKALMKREKKSSCTISSSLPVCLLKLFFQSENAEGIENRAVWHSGSRLFSPSPLKRCYLQSNGTKADSKKDKVRDGNPVSIHDAPTGEVLDFSSRILCRRLVSRCSIPPPPYS